MKMCEKILGVRVLCSHTPSVTVDRYQLSTKPTVTKKRFEQKKNCELTSNSIRMRTTTRNLEMKANIAILYVGQLERWTSTLQRKLLVLVVCVFVDLDGWALQLVLLIRGVSDFSS